MCFRCAEIILLIKKFATFFAGFIRTEAIVKYFPADYDSTLKTRKKIYVPQLKAYSTMNYVCAARNLRLMFRISDRGFSQLFFHFNQIKAEKKLSTQIE